MRSTLYLATLALLAGIGTARADVYSVSTSLQGEADPDYFLRFTAPHFNQDLGALAGVTLFLYGSIDVTATGNFDEPYANDPATAKVVNNLRFIGDGINTSVISVNLPETATGTYSELHAPGLPVSATFNIPAANVPDYADSAIDLSGDFAIDSNFFKVGTNDPFPFNPGGYIRDIFTGTLTTTFTYQPTHVPEPGSLALLGAAAVMLAGATRLTKRRPRS
jgi:hypothetical protein